MFDNPDAPFNMALATLERLNNLLKKMESLYAIYPQDTSMKQKVHIGLVRSFYIAAIPLFKEEKKKDKEEEKKTKIEDIGKRILVLQLDTKTKVSGGKQSSVSVYSYEKERELNQMVIDIQKELKYFFMPKGRDPAKALSQIG